MTDEARTDSAAPETGPIGQKAAVAPERRALLQLPGLVAISLYMLILAGVVILGVVGRHFQPLILAFAPVFIAAGLGLLLLLRWAWAMTLAAVALLACLFAWQFSVQHAFPFIVQGLLNLVFFLYLVRPEVREKLR